MSNTNIQTLVKIEQLTFIEDNPIFINNFIENFLSPGYELIRNQTIGHDIVEQETKLHISNEAMTYSHVNGAVGLVVPVVVLYSKTLTINFIKSAPLHIQQYLTRAIIATAINREFTRTIVCNQKTGCDFDFYLFGEILERYVPETKNGALLWKDVMSPEMVNLLTKNYSEIEATSILENKPKQQTVPPYVKIVPLSTLPKYKKVKQFDGSLLPNKPKALVGWIVLHSLLGFPILKVVNKEMKNLFPLLVTDNETEAKDTIRSRLSSLTHSRKAGKWNKSLVSVLLEHIVKRNFKYPE